MRTRLNHYVCFFAWLASLLAIVFLVMGAYGDYVVYSMFHNFMKFNLPNWPYYVSSIGIILLTCYKRYIYLCLIAFLIPDVINYQVSYLTVLWVHPNTITLHYTIVLAIIICVMVVSALASGLLGIVNLKDK